jgi:hypothetical protein
MFESIVDLLNHSASLHLNGWSVESFRFWKTEQGAGYAEVKISIFEEELFIRLREYEGSIRVVAAQVKGPSQRDGNGKNHEITGRDRSR